MPSHLCEGNEGIHASARNGFLEIEVMTATPIKEKCGVEVDWQGSVAEGLHMGAVWEKRDGWSSASSVGITALGVSEFELISYQRCTDH